MVRRLDALANVCLANASAAHSTTRKRNTGSSLGTRLVRFFLICSIIIRYGTALRKAVRLFPESQRYHDLLAECYFEAGKPIEGLREATTRNQSVRTTLAYVLLALTGVFLIGLLLVTLIVRRLLRPEGL
jgi:hypothetical protein